MDSSKVMTLEEFLTLCDVKDGITTLTRIEELITLMQKEEDGGVKSANEATRQHSAIARVVAATKNTSCLDHFIKLGGIWHMNGWLNNALTSAADTSDDFIESITLQCTALEKLCISNEILISSGIFVAVKNLSDHNNTIIKEKARELLDSWTDVALTFPKNEEDKATKKTDDDGSLLEVIDVGPEQTEASPNFVDAVKDEGPVLGGSGCLQLVEGEQIKAEATCCQMTAPDSLDQIKMDGEAISVTIKTGVGIPEIVTYGEDIVNVDNSNSLGMRDNTGDEELGAHENTNNKKVTEKINSTSADLKIAKFTQFSSSQESVDCSSIADILMAEAEQTMPEDGTQTNICCKESPVTARDEFVDDTKKALSENSSRMDDTGHQSLVRGSPERTTSTQDAVPAITASDIVVGLNSRSDEDYSKASAIQNLARDTKSSAVTEARSDVDLDYGLMDALEVARQVAKAVKMDMVNDGSSENISDASRRPGSPDSTNEIDSQYRNLSEESNSDSFPRPSTEMKAESSSSEKMHSEPEECMQGVDQPQSLVQEVQVNNNENTCGFDLNQEVPYEAAEFSVNFNQNMGEENGALAIQSSSSMPSPVGSSLKSHVDDPQLAQSHGWRGSVGGRAFRQLSPHRNADPYVTLPFDPSSVSGKQKQGTLGIDLNLDKEGNDSNVAAAPAESMEFGFDLNMMSDVEDASRSWRLDKQNFSHLNGRPSSSPAYSLFPMQPTINIDLNEGPAMRTISSRPHPFLVSMASSQNVNVHPFFGTSSQNAGVVQQDAKPVISIMGARVEVDRNDYSYGAPSLSNGKSELHPIESNVGAMGSYLGFGPTGSYGHPSQFGYNNTNAGPGPGPAMSFMSPMFRPGNTMTYMVDPRAGPVPQMVNLPSVAPHMYAQPPFFMSMARPSLGLNGVSPPRPNFDLNLGFTNDGGNRQDMAPRQLFGNNQGRFIGEHLSPPDSQQSSSSGKRKESETGWETYPYNMKHRYPPGNR